MKKKYIFFSTILLLFIGLSIVGWYWTEGYGFTETDVTGETVAEAVFQYNISIGQYKVYPQLSAQTQKKISMKVLDEEGKEIPWNN